MSTQTRYAVLVAWSEEDDAYIASAPQLEGCIADGGTRQEALRNLEDLIDEWMQSAKEKKWIIPPPATRQQLENQTRAQQREYQEWKQRLETLMAAVEKMPPEPDPFAGFGVKDKPRQLQTARR